MTINELEQAIRTLIVSEPMISTGPMAGAITSSLTMISSYRNMSLSAQSYPVQDNFKFNILAELQRFENTLTILMCQSFQEKGINIMAYMMPNSMMPSQSNMMPNSAVNPQVNMMPNQSMMGNGGMMPNGYSQPEQPQGTHSHLSFNQPMGGQRYGGGHRGMSGQQQYPMSAPQGQVSPMGGQYNGSMNPPTAGRPMMGSAQAGRVPRYPNNPKMKRGMRGPAMGPAPAFPGNPANVQPPVGPAIVPEATQEELPRPNVKPSKAALKSQESNPSKTNVKKESSKPPIMLDTEPDVGSGNEGEESSGSAAGRDYLLQLLKK